MASLFTSCTAKRARKVLVGSRGVSSYCPWLSVGSKEWTNNIQHKSISIDPFMMMTTFLTLSGVSILTKKMGGVDNTMAHGYLMFAASGTASFGAYAIWSQKEMYGKPHLTTPHGQFGALTLALFIFYPIAAYIAYNPINGLFKQNQFARKLHKLSGKIIVAFGLITSCFGITSMENDPLKAAALIGSLIFCSPFFLL